MNNNVKGKLKFNFTNVKLCCDILTEQITYQCKIHGQSCPDKLIDINILSGKLGYIANSPNSSYGINFCPWCGQKLNPSALQKLLDKNASPNSLSELIDNLSPTKTTGKNPLSANIVQEKKWNGPIQEPSDFEKFFSQPYTPPKTVDNSSLTQLIDENISSTNIVQEKKWNGPIQEPSDFEKFYARTHTPLGRQFNNALESVVFYTKYSEILYTLKKIYLKINMGWTPTNTSDDNIIINNIKDNYIAGQNDGCDSLDMVELLMAIELEFDINISDELAESIGDKSFAFVAEIIFNCRYPNPNNTYNEGYLRGLSHFNSAESREYMSGDESGADSKMHENFIIGYNAGWDSAQAKNPKRKR